VVAGALVLPPLLVVALVLALHARSRSAIATRGTSRRSTSPTSRSAASRRGSQSS
jgi:hypothetical protein